LLLSNIRNIKAETLLGAVNMPDIAKEPTHLKFDNIVFHDSLFITGFLRYRKRLDRFFFKDLIHKAYSHKKNITSDKYNDSSKKELNSTGRHQEPQLSRHHCLQHGLQQVLHHKPRYRLHHSGHFEQHHSLQFELQQRPHQDRHFKLQQAGLKERELVNFFINEIMYLPLA
jgi:hypothetical protein